jgi:Zn-finger nucleic acid-binding protein
MQCPKCDQSLQAHKVEGQQIDRCPQCKGKWFQQGELQTAKDAAAPDLRWLDFEIWKHLDHYRFSVLNVTCPQCIIPMLAITYGATDVELDYCPKCQGVWLDEGEFGRIISALAKEATTKSVSDYVKASIEEAAEVITGPESSISEWRDLTAVIRLFQYRLLAENPRLHDVLVNLQETAAGF